MFIEVNRTSRITYSLHPGFRASLQLRWRLHTTINQDKIEKAKMVGGTGYRAATSSDSLTKHKNRHGRVRSQISHHGQLTCTFPLQRSVTIATVGLHEPRAYNPPSGTRGCQPNNQTSLPTKKVVATNTDEPAQTNTNNNTNKEAKMETNSKQKRIEQRNEGGNETTK